MCLLCLEWCLTINHISDEKKAKMQNLSLCLSLSVFLMVEKMQEKFVPSLSASVILLYNLTLSIQPNSVTLLKMMCGVQPVCRNSAYTYLYVFVVSLKSIFTFYFGGNSALFS